MIVVTHFRPTDSADFVADLERALAVLAARPGYVRGSAGRSMDDDDAWVMVTEWSQVGDYRRALGNYEVKLHATTVLAQALDLPTAFEQLVAVAPDGSVQRRASDRAPGAGEATPR